MIVYGVGAVGANGMAHMVATATRATGGIIEWTADCGRTGSAPALRRFAALSRPCRQCSESTNGK